MVAAQGLRVPMRDGVHLAADLYLPTAGDRNDGFPVILERTPYDKSGISRSESTLQNPEPITRAEVATFFADHGYAVVMQDCRGRFESEGEFRKYVNEAEDGYDTVAWIAGQSWCNGRIGTMGLSYGAHTQCALAALDPPGLACMFIDSGGFSNAFQSGIRQGGAFEMKQVTWAYRHALLSQKTAADPRRRAQLEKVDIADWMRQLDWTIGDSPLAAAPEYEAYLFEQWKNGMMSDYWRQPALYAEGYYEAFPDIPVAIIGSWYDPYVVAATTHFRELSRLKSSPVHMLIGPWTHGDRSQSWAGGVDFGEHSVLDANIATDYFELRLNWFDQYLRMVQSAASAFDAPVTYFRMGGGGGARDAHGRLRHSGAWRSARTWPPADSEPMSLYLHADGQLHDSAPSGNQGECMYRFDPLDPVPTIGGAVTSGKPVMSGGAFNQVQTADTFAMRPVRNAVPLAKRPDILVFQTAPLERDLEICGPVVAELWISSDRPDTDFTVKLLDVYPPNGGRSDGYAMNLTDGIFRMRYHVSWERECFMKRNEVYCICIKAADVSNLFLRGHRIRIEVSSSNYPRFDINPNTGNPPGDMRDPQVALNTVHCGAGHASHLILWRRHQRQPGTSLE
jgi:putative CocE/NonD family hydrolase